MAESQKAIRKFPKKPVEPAEPQKAVRKRRTGPRPTGRPPGFPLPYIRPEEEETPDVASD